MRRSRPKDSGGKDPYSRYAYFGEQGTAAQSRVQSSGSVIVNRTDSISLITRLLRILHRFRH